MLNVFDHQRFLVRRPDGTRITRSLRELITATTDEGQQLDYEEALTLDYPHPFFNVAALSLMAYLAQIVFEPADADELAKHLDRPMPLDEFEEAVKTYLPSFCINGEDNARFMQGSPERTAGQDEEPVETLMITIPSETRRFLNRPDSSWAVSMNQIPLLLFTRNTFYETASGRSYKNGPNANVPVRTLLLEAADDTAQTFFLRRSIWLNVLSRHFQTEHLRGEYDAGGYNKFMWEEPPEGNVPQHGLSLQAGLGWMVAFHYLTYKTLETPRTCMVTGKVLPAGERAATAVLKKSTGVGYGSSGKRFFRHPNVPTKAQKKRGGGYREEKQYTVRNAQRDLTRAIGGIFFGREHRNRKELHRPAPVVQQINVLANKIDADKQRLYLHASAFVMEGAGAFKNIHAHFEEYTFRYPTIAVADDELRNDLLNATKEMMDEACIGAEKIAATLQRAIRMTAGVGVEVKREQQELKVKRKKKKKRVPGEVGFAEVAAYWNQVPEQLATLVREIAEQGPKDPQKFFESGSEVLLSSCIRAFCEQARSLYAPIYSRYVVQARALPLAQRAKSQFNYELSNQCSFDDAE